jgi:formylglycine-generating enzyme required for sulfatase activity/energy-coupling factor transporter ATP-binding protein EcfA2
MWNQWWDQFLELVTKNAGAIAVVTISAIVGALLTKFLPWLAQRLRDLGGALFALFGGRCHDYQFERDYLNWLIGRHRYLGQLPSNVAVATSEQKQLAELEQIYVALSVTPGGASGETTSENPLLAERRYLGRREQPGWMRLVPARFRLDNERPYSNIGRSIEQHPRLVIRGDPGSGKTTLMKYIAVTCARALRNKPREGDKSTLTYERLGWKDRPFPIFVSLGRHARVANWEKRRSLLDTCGEEFDRELADCPPGFFERRLKRGGCLILLDAFDELGNREARQQIAQHISGLLNKFPNAKNRIVVTTRIVGYEGQLDTRGFVVQTVQPLNDEDIESLVRQRYHAIALNESRDQSLVEVELAQRRTTQKADQLLSELRRNQRLHDLAVNPLLLSLIVLDHSVKLVLPDERHILYRDCVEILAARWRQHSRAQLGLTAMEEELSTPQKIDLLQTLALEMQKQRTREEAGQIPIRRARAEELIAAQLPALLTTLPSEVNQRRALCEQKATAWLDGVKAESGILIELGLDDAGEPLVAFSHLTFQEYLAASVLQEQSNVYPLLLDNLLNPAWEEVLLLYTGIAQEATPIVQKLIAQTAAHPEAWLIAGNCLVERTKIAEPERTAVLVGLHDLVRTGNENQRSRICVLLARVASPNSKSVLVPVAETDQAWSVRYAAAQALGKIGDPRFDRIEPEMVNVPAGEFGMGDEKGKYTVNLPEFRIGKYSVTNAEYKRFVDETGYSAPSDWQENVFPAGKANHPVTRVSWHDAQAYSEWLRQKTGKNYRLPTEAEWEKAARGTDGRVYPWGNEFDKDKCNTDESGINATTPVGIYLDGASPFGALDMAGNVWEWCSSQYREYPYNADDGREELTPAPHQLSLRERFLQIIGRYEEPVDWRIFRGGSWFGNASLARCAYRLRDHPGNRYDYVGFRVAESVLP